MGYTKKMIDKIADVIRNNVSVTELKDMSNNVISRHWQHSDSSRLLPEALAFDLVAANVIPMDWDDLHDTSGMTGYTTLLDDSNCRTQVSGYAGGHEWVQCRLRPHHAGPCYIGRFDRKDLNKS